jgi:hypothetical protein
MNIRLELKGELLKKMDAVKEKLGLENYTEVLRFLINKAYEEMVEK